MKKRPLQIQTEFFEKVWSNADVDAVFDYFDGTAGGLGTQDPLDPVGYIDFYHALSSVVKDVEFEFPFWVEKDDRLCFDFIMKARARKKDKAIFWHGSAIGHYRDGKIAGGENFLDFVDLFQQLELLPEQTVELGLAGEEILRIERTEESLGKEFRRLFWPGYRAADGLISSFGLPSRKQLEVLFHSAVFGMVVTDIADNVLNTNRHFDELIDGPVEKFSDLIVGKGKVAEKRARDSLIRGESSNYRILLHLQTRGGLVRVWVSAVLFQQDGGSAGILRSIERDELIDDLLSLQDAERRLLSEDLNREVLGPVLDLLSHFSSRASMDPALRLRCVETAGEIAAELREKIRDLRNPILEGVTLSKAWPELSLDTCIDDAGETASLIAYRVVSESVSHLRSSLDELRLTVNENELQGSIPVDINGQEERFNLLRNLCSLAGGRMMLVEGEEKRSELQFCLPCSGVGTAQGG